MFYNDSVIFGDIIQDFLIVITPVKITVYLNSKDLPRTNPLLKLRTRIQTPVPPNDKSSFIILQNKKKELDDVSKILH